MNRILIGILLLVIIGGGAFMTTKNTPVSSQEVRAQIKKDFLDNEECFLAVQKYCLKHPEIANRGITIGNYKNLPEDANVIFVLEKLNYSNIYLAYGEEADNYELTFIKIHDSDQEEYSLVYSTKIQASRYEEIIPNWYVTWIYYT